MTYQSCVIVQLLEVLIISKTLQRLNLTFTVSLFFPRVTMTSLDDFETKLNLVRILCKFLKFFLKQLLAFTYHFVCRL